MGSGPAARDSPTREGIAAPTRARQPQESCHEPPWLLPRAAGCTSLSLTAAWNLPVGVGRGTLCPASCMFGLSYVPIYELTKVHERGGEHLGCWELG